MIKLVCPNDNNNNAEIQCGTGAGGMIQLVLLRANATGRRRLKTSQCGRFFSWSLYTLLIVSWSIYPGSNPMSPGYQCVLTHTCVLLRWTWGGGFVRFALSFFFVFSKKKIELRCRAPIGRTNCQKKVRLLPLSLYRNVHPHHILFVSCSIQRW